jgi:hypothetical protein
MTADPNSSPGSESTAAEAMALWQGQPVPAFRLSPAALADADRAHVRLRRRVVAQSAVMVVGIVATLWFAVNVDVLLIRIGSLAAAVGFGLRLGLLQRRRRSAAEDAAVERASFAAPSLVYYRAALVRECDQYTGRRLWLPFAISVPAALLLMLGIVQAVPALERYVWIELAMFSVAMQRLQARIDDLDALTRSS